MHGALLHWADASHFADKLEDCDQIEGYTGGHQGLYQRSIVQVKTQAGVVSAYTYHQDLPHNAGDSNTLHFPQRTWLGPHGRKPAPRLEL